jgi:hypothetical protein
MDSFEFIGQCWGNASFVQEIRPCATGEYELRLRCGKEYTVTRTYNKNLRSLAEFWIGTGTFKACCRFIVSCSFELK